MWLSIRTLIGLSGSVSRLPPEAGAGRPLQRSSAVGIWSNVSSPMATSTTWRGEHAQAIPRRCGRSSPSCASNAFFVLGTHRDEQEVAAGSTEEIKKDAGLRSEKPPPEPGGVFSMAAVSARRGRGGRRGPPRCCALGLSQAEKRAVGRSFAASVPPVSALDRVAVRLFIQGALTGQSGELPRGQIGGRLKSLDDPFDSQGGLRRWPRSWADGGRGVR